MSASSGASERKNDANGADLLVVILVVMLVFGGGGDVVR
jgi:hypothetical protein